MGNNPPSPWLAQGTEGWVGQLKPKILSIKGTVDVFSSDPSFIQWHVRFTPVSQVAVNMAVEMSVAGFNFSITLNQIKNKFLGLTQGCKIIIFN